MYIESLRPAIEHIPEWTLVLAPAIAWFIKASCKQDVTDDRKKWKDLEIHHVNPRYKGGKDSIENCKAVSRVQHAQEHYLMARNAETSEDRAANDWAVRAIVRRMKRDELALFNEWIKMRGGMSN